MKLLYRKPLIFPTWGIFSGKDAGKTYYRLADGGVIFTPEKDKLPHHNHRGLARCGRPRLVREDTKAAITRHINFLSLKTTFKPSK